MTAPLDAFLSLVHAFDWLHIRDRDDKAALHAFFDGQFGDPIDIALGKVKIRDGPEAERFARLFDKARTLVAEERFLNWQVVFPGVWSDWHDGVLRGGFDAVIGNPPWDRMKLQQVEWFAVRRREIALAQRATDRKRMIAALAEAGDPLADDFIKGQRAGGSRRTHGPFIRRISAAVRRRFEYLFAVYRTGDETGQAHGHGRAFDAFGDCLG
jgi:hypothetical protein